MDTSIEVCRYLFEVNTLGTINLTGCLLPHMTEKKDGSIVIISSIAGKLGEHTDNSLYCSYIQIIKCLVYFQ